MSYEVKTPVFEGPLDLLLQLITSHQVVITDLSLADLVTEYLRHLEIMRDLDLEVTSEFIIIASTLIQLKARSLLPDDRPIDLDDELALAEERDRLLARLLACLTFKDVAAVLAHRFEAAGRFLPRLAGLEEDVRPARPEFRLGRTAEDLAHIADGVFSRAGAEPEIEHLDMDLPSVEDAIADLRSRMAASLRSDFDALVAHCDRTIEVVAYFLALLELARWGVVGVAQEHRDAPILVTHNPGARDDPAAHSDWAG